MDENGGITPAGESAKPASARRVRHGLIEDWRDAVGLLVLLLVAAFFGAVIARFWPLEGVDASQATADLDARVGSIEARLSDGKQLRELADVRDRIKKLEARVLQAETLLTAASVGGSLAATALDALPGTAAGPTPGGALTTPDAARKALDDLAARLAALETKTAKTPEDLMAARDSLASVTASLTDLRTKLDAFTERLARIENSDLLEMARRASLATAIANLTRAAQGSAPFKREYDVVAAMVPGDARLTAIAPLAARGLPTVSTLITSFGDLADAALDAERLAKAEDMWTRLWANFMGLIASRTVGETGDNSTEGRLARAENRLKAGDLAAALRELQAIKGPAREPLKPWLAQASARIRLEYTLGDLNTRAIEALSGPTSDASDAPVPQGPEP
jgi:hypothetical protein